MVDALCNPLPKSHFTELINSRVKDLQTLVNIFTEFAGVSTKQRKVPKKQKRVPEEKQQIITEQKWVTFKENKASDQLPLYVITQGKQEPLRHCYYKRVAMQLAFAIVDIHKLHENPGLFKDHFVSAVLDPERREIKEFWHLIKDPRVADIRWQAVGNKWGLHSSKLKSGIKGTNEVVAIKKDDVHIDHWKDMTYTGICTEYREQNEEKHWLWTTIGNNRINYPSNISIRTEQLTTIKLLLNSVVSTLGASFMTSDIKQVYLNTPLKPQKLTKVHISILPYEIIEENK